MMGILSSIFFFDFFFFLTCSLDDLLDHHKFARARIMGHHET
jgi:hypothetical protein